MIVKAPTGSLIIGTQETVPARCELSLDGWSIDADGSLQWEHCGDSEVFWDGMTTDEWPDGGPVFEDEDGEAWPMQCLIIEEGVP